MVTMLATLDISKAIGEDGEQITPDVELTPGLTRSDDSHYIFIDEYGVHNANLNSFSHPTHFPCVMKPRSRLARELVEDTM